jgi:large subunit ribosomal protein L3
VLGLIGKKVGMTQAFDEKENLVALTVIEAGPCPVIQVKTADRDGYVALKVGFGTSRRAGKARQGESKGVGAPSILREFRLGGSPVHAVGDLLDVDVFKAGERVDVIGRSKGRGYAGAVKRHNFRGGPRSHGQSDRHRAPGSIGASSDPSRVFKGVRMAGHMGDDRVTVRGLTVYGVDKSRNLILLRGAVPGGKGATVVVRKR